MIKKLVKKMNEGGTSSNGSVINMYNTLHITKESPHKGLARIRYCPESYSS